MPARTAVIMVDVQNMYLQQESRDRYGWPAIYRMDETVAECAALLAEAREQGLPVIYTRAVSRADGADATPSMRALREAVAADFDPLTDDSDWSSEIMDAVAPHEGDIVIKKLRWDAFYGTELDSILRNLDVNRLIIAGLQTNVCVDTTARTALMKNFEVAVPVDAVSTDGKHLHFNGLDALRVIYVEIAPWRDLIAPGAKWDVAVSTPGYGRLLEELPHPAETL
ncbi:isochorismatase family cysteine hydrolase [Glaciihabitans sp. UYNi722]|uniref:cysteine hydrolase family protein n=1 Tax=Glaciihabitans sp. UYNi722 TaxID=3156344 RepID=UPI0033911C68